jgi:hypothetical protein
MKRSALQVLATLCLLLGMARLGSAADDLVQWKTFIPGKGGFSVSVPGIPMEAAQPDGVAYGLDQGSLALAIVYNDYAPAKVEQQKPETLLNAARDAMLVEERGKKSKLLSEGKVAQSGIEGREFRAATTGGILLRVRLFLVKQRMYQLIVAMPLKSEKGFEKQTLKFLDSFQLVAPPKSP